MASVSVIVPSYNHGRFLDECLAGVVAQTFLDWELVLVDDVSQDDSVARAREWAGKDPRIQVHVNPQNSGTYQTLQNALNMARGGMVAVLNSDDIWEPTKLERQVAALVSAPHASACVCLGWMVDESGRKDTSEDPHAGWPTGAVTDYIPWLLIENRILASSVLFRRAGLRFETSCRYSGDWVALIEAALRGPFACVNERLSHWRQHGHNTYTMSPQQVAEEIRVRESVRTLGQGWGRPLSEPLAHGLAANALNLAALYALIGQSKSAKARVAESSSYRDVRVAARRRLLLSLPAGMARKRLWGRQVTDFGPYDALPWPNAGPELIKFQSGGAGSTP